MWPRCSHCQASKAARRLGDVKPHLHLLGYGTGAQQALATKSAARSPSAPGPRVGTLSATSSLRRRSPIWRLDRLAPRVRHLVNVGADLESLRIDLIGTGYKRATRIYESKSLSSGGLGPSVSGSIPAASTTKCSWTGILALEWHPFQGATGRQNLSGFE